MSNRQERAAEDRYEAQNDPSPVSGDPVDNSYVTGDAARGGASIPVERDDAPYEDPVQPPYSNSDKQLAQDEREAIDKSNILKGDRTRHAKPQTENKYSEGPEEDDLPAEVLQGDTGTSATR